MLRPLAFAALASTCLAAVARADDEFPYTAFVAADEVNVRSGPGENYYPVLKLERGAKVEVYRHDPGGWYAIRPPEGSFSWVAAELIKPGDRNIGVVNDDRVVARVGSLFSDVRDVIQIRLDRGEEIQILEAKRFNNGPAAQTWYKIAPPAGEFRWIAGKFVDREPRVAVPRERGPSNNLLLAKMAKASQAPDAEADPQGRDYDAEAEESDDPQPIRRRDAPRSFARSDWTRREARVDESEGPDDAASVEPRQVTRRNPPAVTAKRTSPADLSAQLDEMDLELSAIVADEPQTWDFRDLHTRAENALADCETAVERGKARVLLGKLARFEDIRQRYMAVVDTRANTDRRNRELASSPAMRAGRPFSDDPRYDGVGKLAQVVTSKVGTPRYALLDESGEIVYYVTPAPGVNLRNYLGRQVGVVGTLGFLPEQQRQHVTARHIVPVGDTLVR